MKTGKQAKSSRAKAIITAAFALCCSWIASDVLPNELPPLEGSRKAVGRFAFSPTESIAARVSGDRTVTLWHVSTGKRLRALQSDAILTLAPTFSPDGKWLACGCEYEGVRVWNVRTGKIVRKLIGAENRVYSVAFSPNGRILVGGGRHGVLVAWNLRTGKQIHSWGSFHGIHEAVFSPNGRTIAAAVELNGNDPADAIKIWDARTAKLKRTLDANSPLPNTNENLQTIAYSPNGRWIASGSYFSLRVWDARSGKLLRTLAEHKDWNHAVNSVAFSSDGRTLAVGKSNGVVELWDTRTWKQIGRYKHPHKVWSVAFSPDGRTLVTGSDDGLVRLWKVN